MNSIKCVWLSVMVIGLGLCVTRPVFGAGAFSQSGPLGASNLDASVGLSTNKTYTHAYNIYGGSGTTNINGVAFTNLANANYTGVGNSFSMAGWDSNLAGGDVIGVGSGLGFLLNSFNYKTGNGLFQQTLTLNNLEVGKFYILTFYNKSYGAAGGRLQALSSSGGAEGVFDEDLGGKPNANVLRYTFMATNTNEWVRFAALIVNASYHLYGFSTEVLSLTNTWTSGGLTWSTSNWSAGVPDGQNAQAVFPPQESPTAIMLDTPAKIGHLQLDGANAYTLDGPEALTVWTDVGGAGVFNVVTGSHVIAVSTVLSNDMVKLGAGALSMSGIISGPRIVNVGAGTLVLSGTNTYSGGTAINGGSVLTLGTQAAATPGAVAVNGSTYDLGGFAVTNGMITMNSGTISNGTLTGKAYLFSGGTAYANLAGPGTLTNKTGKAILYGANTYGGGSVITSGGTLMLGAQAAAANAGAVTVSGGVYDLGGLEAVTNGVITMSSGVISNGTLAGASYVFSGGAAYANLSGTGALTNTTGTTVLYGANTYSGGTAINSGMLSITNIISLPGSDIVGRFSVASGGTLSVGNGVTDSNIAGMLGAGSFLSGANIALDTSAGDRTCAVALTNAGTLWLVKSGNNTLTLSPAAATAGLIVKQGKVIVVSGTVSNNALNDAVGNVAGDSGALVLQGLSRYVKTPVASVNYLALGNASGCSGTLTISDSAVFQAPAVYVGNYGAGAIYQTGGSSVQTASSGIENLMIGRNTGAYGFYSLSGGTQSNVGQNLSIGYAGLGIYYQSGNSMQVGGSSGGTVYIPRYGGGTGVFYVTGGLISRSNNAVYFGNEQTTACRGEWTMAGGTGTVTTITFGYNAASGNTGILNLNGGVLQVNAINQNQVGALANLNFNGGTLQARQNSAGLFALTGNSGAYVYPGGAVIDDNGFNITIAQNLLAPAGNGVSGVPAFSPLGGYIGAPYVQISGGGGTGTTAVAVFDRASSNVTGIVVTSPGFSYTSAPTVTLVGGGKANYSLGTATLAANTSGGLTKLGAGSLKLSGLNTYTGTTTISNGTFRLGQPSALPANAAVFVAGGTYDLSGFTITNGSVTLSGGTIANGWLAAASLNVSGTNASITASLSGNARKTGNGTLTLRGAQSGISNVTVAGGTLKLADLNAAPPGAVACYRFDGTAADAAGGHTGMIEGTGSSYVSGRSANAGQAINFSGSQAVAVTYASDLSLNAYTISAWVSLNTMPGTFGILGTRFNGDTTFDLKVQSTLVHGDVGSGGGWLNTAADFNVVVSTNEWHMITYAVDNATQKVRMYYDGVLANTVGFSGTPLLMKAGQTLKIGLSSGNEYMNGKMDDVFIFNNALSADQVAQLYQEGVTPPTGILPVTANVTVDVGTTLDLNGHAQTLANLYGYGLVTNGALTVTGALAPGGTNAIAIGTLTLATIPTLSGTLLIDLKTDGSCDLLQVQGSLNLVNVDLQIQDLGQLGFGKEYVIARFTPGSLTGRFQSNNLNNLRAISYNNAAGEIRLVGRGTMISFR
jgi:autotransporter-associated beta strand protein